MAATMSAATRGSRRAGPKNDSSRSGSSPVARTVAMPLRRPIAVRTCSRNAALAIPGNRRHIAAAFFSASGGNWS